MRNPVHGSAGALLAAGLASAFLFVACDGSSSGTTSNTGPGGAAELVKVEYGRLVDVYAYRRIDPARGDRRDTLSREQVLVQRDVVIGPDVQGQQLFDAVGEENTGADFRFMPFDVAVGHEELLILWDDRDPGEQARFETALATAQSGLVEVPGSFSGQNTLVRPMPVVPRNAAIKLTFNRNLGLNSAFFSANPGAVQLLEFRGDPAVVPAPLAFAPVPFRLLVSGSAVILDTTLIGAEAAGGVTSPGGLPESLDNINANIRIAIPSNGVVSSQLNLDPDEVPTLNGQGANGEAAVIRDFRSGNDADGAVGALLDTEPPAVVGDIGMGIIGVDRNERVITLNKRLANVAVRARVPFVDGGIVSSSNLPGGPPQVPTEISLRSGDILEQDVTSPTGEVVRLRAEILQNLDVGSVVGDPNLPVLGLTAAGDDGGEASTVRVRVASLSATDSAGNVVRFEANSTPLGQDCRVRVRYYHNIPYTSGAAVVSDAARVSEFVVFDPAPPILSPSRTVIPRGTLLSPFVTVALRFSEPIDLGSVDVYGNLFISNNSFRPAPGVTVGELLLDPKAAALSMQAARLVDANRDATLLQLQTPLGLYHEKDAEESYWIHLLANVGNADAIAQDLAGNILELYDRNLLAPLDTLSVEFTLDPDAEDNLVGSRIMRFESVDEDGTPDGTPDFFGQFQINDGALGGAATSRFSQVADAASLTPILRFDKGECWDTSVTPPATLPPDPLVFPPGQLYQCPSHVVTVFQSPNIFGGGPVNFGGVLEPLNQRGSRLQMTYREDDFSLSYTDPSTFMLDIEQMHWSPWASEPVKFDTFDRITISLAHADWRPDLLYGLVSAGMPPTITCDLDCASLFSGLSDLFSDNYLQGSSPVDVVVDQVYQLNPNDSFLSNTQTLFTPYPEFKQTYTWRDSRHVSWDMDNNAAIGLSGSKLPDGVFPARDRTAHVSSPWIPDALPPGFPGTAWVIDAGDFRGDRVRDHDPIAMPLLMEFQVFPDSPANGLASGANSQHIAIVGPCWAPAPGGPGGFYNLLAGGGVAACNGALWPKFRVHSSGGVDTLGNEIFVDPANVFQATGGWVFNPGIGDPQNARRQVPSGDDHLHWSQADFVRKTSMVTYGFFDTLQPNRHDLPSTYQTSWSGLTNKPGVPDFLGLAQARNESYSVSDLLTVSDPPLAAQPAGTSVQIEFRWADTFDNDDRIYDQPTLNTVKARGNLLNPNYACEAYRYASPNSDASGLSPGTDPRVVATGLTPYVREENLDSLRDPSGLLPRFSNMRIVFVNRVDGTPPASPSLRSLAVVYRMASR